MDRKLIVFLLSLDNILNFYPNDRRQHHTSKLVSLQNNDFIYRLLSAVICDCHAVGCGCGNVMWYGDKFQTNGNAYYVIFE